MTFALKEMKGHIFYATTNKLPKESKFTAQWELWLHLDGCGIAKHIFGSVDRITKDHIETLDFIGYFDATKYIMIEEYESEY